MDDDMKKLVRAGVAWVVFTAALSLLGAILVYVAFNS